MEIWRDILGYEGLYQVSNEGRVRSLNYNKTKQIKIIKPFISRCGYLIVLFSMNGKRKHFQVHRLVAEAFIPNPNNYPQVNHKDENPENNRVENLEWCDCFYNINYGKRTEKARKKLLNHPQKSKQIYQYTIGGELVAIWPSSKECGRNGFFQSAVNRCCNGKIKTHKGYRWSFEPL